MAADGESKPDAELKVELTALADQWAEANDFSGSWQVQRGDTIFAQGSRGTIGSWSDEPIDPDTVFWIGSNSKHFAAVAVMLLVEQGKMSLDEPFRNYLPQLESSALRLGQVDCSLDHILSHRCGLPRQLFNRTTIANHLNDPSAAERLLSEVAALKLDYEPGTQFVYSNLGYQLAGLAVQEVSGIPYEEFLRRNFWKPLAMNHTGIQVRPGLTAAKGQSGALFGWINTSSFLLIDESRIGEMGAAGNIYSTPADMSVWHQALHRGKVLTAASYKELIRPRLDGYALGLDVSSRDFGTLIRHSGAISPEGFSSQFAYLPSTQWSFVVHSNYPLGAVSLTSLGSSIVRTATGNALNPPRKPSGLRERALASIFFVIFLGVIPLYLWTLWVLLGHGKPLPRQTWLLNFAGVASTLGVPLFLFQSPSWHPVIFVWFGVLLMASWYSRWWTLKKFDWRTATWRLRSADVLSAAMLLFIVYISSTQLTYGLVALALLQIPAWLIWRNRQSQN